MKTILFLVFNFVLLGSAWALDDNLENVLREWNEVEFSVQCCQKSAKVIDFSTTDGVTSVAAIQLVFPDEKEMLAPVSFIAPDADTIYDFLFGNVLGGDTTLGDIINGGGYFSELELKRAFGEIVSENDSAYPEKAYEILNFNGGGRYYKTSAIALVNAKTKVGLVLYVQGSNKPSAF